MTTIRQLPDCRRAHIVELFSILPSSYVEKIFFSLFLKTRKLYEPFLELDIMTLNNIKGCERGVKTISIKLPLEIIEALDELVRHEIFASRSEAIRVAARDLLQKLVFNVGTTMRIADNNAEMLEEDMPLIERLSIP